MLGFNCWLNLVLAIEIQLPEIFCTVLHCYLRHLLLFVCSTADAGCCRTERTFLL